MFFQGTLQEGIAQAMREQKLVSCFVTDSGQESNDWELWLSEVEDNVKDTVLLRLTAGGQEAGFLAAFCTIETAPAFIFIRDGKPVMHLKSGMEREEFKTAIRDAYDVKSAGREPDFETTPAGESSNRGEVESNPTVQTTIPSGLTQASIHATTQADARPQATSKPLSSKQEREKAEQTKRAAEIKKNQSDALAERTRVLRQIENDRKERKALEQERKAMAKAEEKQLAAETKQAEKIARKSAKECSLKVRIFDGSTISATFPSKQTLNRHVRSWIDETLGSLEAPYEFKQVLSPMPNQRISAAEEEETLVSIGLAPNATLVMVPIEGYSVAYSGSAPSIMGGVGMGLSYGYDLISGGLASAGNLVGSLLGGRQAETEEEEQGPTIPIPASGSNVRVRTLADQRRGQDDQQLYNGNQLNFERRKDDEAD